MSNKFTNLFSVDFKHNYYTDERNSDFHITPTLSCMELLKDFGMLFRETVEGFTVLYPEFHDGDKDIPFKPIDINLKFSFMIKSRNPYFLNISDLPLNISSSKIYYFNNLTENTDDGALYLASDLSNRFISDTDRMSVKPQAFHYVFDSVETSSLVEVLDEANRVVFSEKVFPVEEVYQCFVNLAKFPPGRFVLKIDDVQSLVFYASNELYKTPVFGIIDIFKNDILVPESYQFVNPVDSKNVSPKNYRVYINNRKTFWRYNVILKYNKEYKPHRLSVKHPVRGTKFNKNGVQSLPDGTSVVQFESKEQLSLLEKPVKGIKLRRKVQGKKEVEIENLPNPNIKFLNPDLENDKVFSDILIYI